MKNIYIGIDIGKKGAIAIIKENEIETIEMPMIKTELDYHEISDKITDLAQNYTGHVHIIFEKLGVIFGTGKQVAFSMGQQSGAIEMACICNNVSYTKVNAKDWQKEMLAGVQEITKSSISGKKQIRDTKAMALLAVKRLFPKLKLTFGSKAIKPHDGLIDAVLIAEYARRKNL